MKTKLIITLAIVTACLCGSYYTAKSQDINRDSLQNIINTAKDDAIRVNALQAYATNLVEQKQDDEKAMSYIDQSVQLAEKTNNYFANANAGIIKGNFYFYKNEWVKSIEALEKTLKLSAKITDPAKRLKVSYDATVLIAEVYAYNGDFVQALDFRLKALKIIESTEGNFIEKGEAYVGIINDFRHLKQNSKAVEYIKKAGAIFDKMDNDTRFNYMYEYYQNLLFFDKIEEAKAMLVKYDSSLTVYHLSRQGKIDFASMSAKLHGQFEMSYTHDYAAALFHFKKYLQLSLEGKDRVHTGIALNKMGGAYDSLHQYENALQVLQVSFDTSMHSKSFDYAFKCADEMATIYEKTGNLKKAVEYSNIAFKLKEDLANDEKLKELNFLEAKYQANKRETEIATLTLSNKEKELKVVKRNRALLIGGIGVGALLLLLGLLYRNSKQKQALSDAQQKLQQGQIQFLEGQQQVVSLQSMLNGQETERTRIAKDLHDGLGGLFSTVKMHFSTLQHDVPQLKENQLFNKSYELVDTASVEVRRIAHNMMPEVLMKLGLVDGLKDMCNNINAGKLMNISLQAYGMEKRLNSSTEIMLYRIMQELVNNIMKHAQATEAIVQFNREGNRMQVTVEDNGRGFNTKEANENKQAGLGTVQSRVKYLNGQLSIESEKDLGTTVIMDFLVNEE